MRRLPSVALLTLVVVQDPAVTSLLVVLVVLVVESEVALGQVFCSRS